MHERLINSKLFGPVSSLPHAGGIWLQWLYKIKKVWFIWMWKKPNQIVFLTLPKVTNPAFADNASPVPRNSSGAEGDHIQSGAVLRPAVRLASTNS